MTDDIGGEQPTRMSVEPADLARIERGEAVVRLGVLWHDFARPWPVVGVAGLSYHVTAVCRDEATSGTRLVISPIVALIPFRVMGQG